MKELLSPETNEKKFEERGSMAGHRVKNALLSALVTLAVLTLSGCSVLNARTASAEAETKGNDADMSATTVAEVQAHGLAWNLARLALTEKTLNATVRERVVLQTVDATTFDPTSPGEDIDRAAPALTDRMLGRVLTVPQWLIVVPVDAKPLTTSLGCSVAAERFATEVLEAAKKTAQADDLWVPVHEWGRWRETLYIYLQVNKRGGVGQAPESLEWKLSLPCNASALPQMTREELLSRVPGMDALGIPAGERFTVIGLTMHEGKDERDSAVTRSFTYSATSRGRTRDVFLSKFLPAMGRNLPEGVFMITPGVQEAGRMATTLKTVPFVATKDLIVPFVRRGVVEVR